MELRCTAALARQRRPMRLRMTTTTASVSVWRARLLPRSRVLRQQENGRLHSTRRLRRTHVPELVRARQTVEEMERDHVAAVARIRHDTQVQAAEIVAEARLELLAFVSCRTTRPQARRPMPDDTAYSSDAALSGPAMLGLHLRAAVLEAEEAEMPDPATLDRARAGRCACVWGSWSTSVVTT